MSSSLEQAQGLVLEYTDLGESVLSALGEFPSHGGWEAALQLATIGLTTKACRTSHGICLLLQHGLPGEAEILLRVLVELTVTVLAIGHDPRKRAPLYVDYQHIVRYRQWERAVKHVEIRRALFAEDPQQAGQLKERNDAYRGHYSTRKGDRVRNKWHEEELATLAEEAGLDDLWDAMYGVDSGLVHSGPDRLAHYVRQPRPRQIEIGELDSPLLRMRVLLDVTTCMQRVLDQFLKVFASASGRSELLRLSRQRQALFSQARLPM